jgi:hypothetical protein
LNFEVAPHGETLATLAFIPENAAWEQEMIIYVEDVGGLRELKLVVKCVRDGA